MRKLHVWTSTTGGFIQPCSVKFDSILINIFHRIRLYMRQKLQYIFHRMSRNRRTRKACRKLKRRCEIAKFGLILIVITICCFMFFEDDEDSTLQAQTQKPTLTREVDHPLEVIEILDDKHSVLHKSAIHLNSLEPRLVSNDERFLERPEWTDTDVNQGTSPSLENTDTNDDIQLEREEYRIGVISDTPIPIVSNFPIVKESTRDQVAHALFTIFQEIRTNLTDWTMIHGKNVEIFGNPRLLSISELRLYNWAFGRLLFDVNIQKSPPTLTNSSVLFWLGFRSSGYQDFRSNLRNQPSSSYVIANKIPYLFKVLQKKESLCNIFNEAPSSLIVLRSYLFECWNFPKEFHSAVAYADSYPKSVFKVEDEFQTRRYNGKEGLEILQNRTVLVQQTVLSNPKLIRGQMLVLNIYALVTSIIPLRAYVYNQGLVYFLVKGIPPPMCSVGQEFSRFFSILLLDKGSTWSLDDLQQYLDAEQEGAYQKLMWRTQASISLVLLSAERSLRSLQQSVTCKRCHELLSFEIHVDSTLRPKLNEIWSPNLKLSKASKDYEIKTKTHMVRDLTSLIALNPNGVANELSRKLGETIPQQTINELSPAMYDYLYHYYREKLLLGGWIPVYPSYRHYHAQEEFLRSINFIGKSSRMQLHYILGSLENKYFNKDNFKLKGFTHSYDLEDDWVGSELVEPLQPKAY